MSQEKAKKNEAATEQRYFALRAAADLYTELNKLEREIIPELAERVTSLERKIEEEKELVEDLEDASQV